MRAELLLAAIVIVSPVAAASPEWVNVISHWRLSDVEGADGVLFLHEDESFGTQQDIAVSAGDVAAWATMVPAIADFELCEAHWEANLLIKEGTTIHVSVGVVKPGGELVPVPPSAAAEQGPLGPIRLPPPLGPVTDRNEHVTFTSGCFLLAAGERLGILLNPEGGNLLLGTGDRPDVLFGDKEGSQLTIRYTYFEEPPYPELSSLALAGAGLAFVALAALRRR